MAPKSNLSRRENVSITTSAIFFNQSCSKIAVADNYSNLKILENASLSDDQEMGDSPNLQKKPQEKLVKVIKFDENVRFLTSLTRNFLAAASKASSFEYAPDLDSFFLAATKSAVFLVRWNTAEIVQKIFQADPFNTYIMKIVDNYILLGNGNIYQFTWDEDWMVDDKIEMGDIESESLEVVKNAEDFKVKLVEIGPFWANSKKTTTDLKIQDFKITSKHLAIIGNTNNGVYFFKRYNLVKKEFDLKFGQNADYKLLETIKLGKMPDIFDFNENFGVFVFNGVRKSFGMLVHLQSCSVIKTLTLDEEDANAASCKAPGADQSTNINTAKFHPTGQILMSKHGSNNLKIFDTAGNYKKSLTADFNVNNVHFNVENNSILAVGGFSNKIELFYDLIFKSHELVV